jgi:hypothetical protein
MKAMAKVVVNSERHCLALGLAQSEQQALTMDGCVLKIVLLQTLPSPLERQRLLPDASIFPALFIMYRYPSRVFWCTAEHSRRSLPKYSYRVPLVILNPAGTAGPFCARTNGSTAALTGVAALVGAALRL